ncbi:MAG: flagellar hook capping FlgD N-terminal domain-containing protein [Terriglobales bacterium]
MHASLLQMLQPAQAAARSNATSSSATTSSSSSTATDPGADLTNTFLQLLTVQLKNQSPLDPVDPNQFVTQLAQFNSLGELTQIQELMQTLVNNTSPTTSTAGASANAISTARPNSMSH